MSPVRSVFDCIWSPNTTIKIVIHAFLGSSFVTSVSADVTTVSWIYYFMKKILLLIFSSYDWWSTNSTFSPGSGSLFSETFNPLLSANSYKTPIAEVSKNDFKQPISLGITKATRTESENGGVESGNVWCYLFATLSSILLSDKFNLIGSRQ